MAKLYFKYGSMGSSKTAQALMTRFNYQEKDKNVWLIKPSQDTRDGTTIIKSRIGLEAEAYVVNPDTNILLAFLFKNSENKIDAVIVDETQFLAPEQVVQLRDIASNLDVPVLCFGLRTDFQGKLFPGSKALFELADSVAEIKSICKCGSKAIINARLDEAGNVITDGPQVCIGGNERYEAMCWACWNRKIENII